MCGALAEVSHVLVLAGMLRVGDVLRMLRTSHALCELLGNDGLMWSVLARSCGYTHVHRTPQQLAHALATQPRCRDCGARTMAKVARTCTGRLVHVCIPCSEDPRAYSSMVTRRQLVAIGHGPTRVRAMRVAKVGINRRFYYWRHASW